MDTRLVNIDKWHIVQIILFSFSVIKNIIENYIFKNIKWTEIDWPGKYL